jgi:hypothetical protein
MIQTANCVDDNDSGLSKAWSAMLTNVEDDVIKSPDVNFPPERDPNSQLKW